MNGNKKVILHLTFDGILFDRMYSRFEKMEGYENRYLLETIGGANQLKYIKNIEKIERADSLDEWGKIVSDPQVDILFLHGLWRGYLKAVDLIQSNVKVMWWCYGMEIYENVFGRPALMGLNIYKPRTLRFYLSCGPFYIRLLHRLLLFHPRLYVLIRMSFDIVFRKPERNLKKMLSRIDYVWTPLETEFDEFKKRHPYIKGKPYRLRPVVNKDDVEIHNQTGGILLEHSANITNNHLDILDSIKRKKINLSGRTIYIPLSYGEKKMARLVEEEAKFEGATVHCLKNPLPLNDYNEMISSCSHAVYGMLRQSGLGNVYLCFRKGIKVFFFEDSILFKQFKKDGYYVYSIENDLNDHSIESPLTPEEAIHNYNLFYTQFECSNRTFEQQFDAILNG